MKISTWALLVCALHSSLALFAQNVTNLGTGSGTAGNLDVYVGYEAGNASTSSAAYNVAVGPYALYTNTSGSENVAMGRYALYLNTTGTYNAALGYTSLYHNTSGSYNVASGPWSLYTNTTGSYNTASGYAALNLNTTASYNTAFGFQACYGMTGQNNTGVGYTVLNTSVGSSGTDNTGIGYSSMQNTTGSLNTASGSNSLFTNTSGSDNTANGYKSLYANTTGGNNTAVGYQSLLTNTTGSNNTAVGYGVDVSSAALTNATSVGNGAIATASNTVQLGNSAVTQVFAGTGTNATLVTGGLRVTGGTLGAGKVLTSDASGNATWQTPSSGSSLWTVSGSNAYFTSGNVGIGTTSPTYTLDVQGTAPTMRVYSNSAPNSAVFETNASGVVGFLQSEITPVAGVSAGTRANYDFYLATNGTNRMVLKNSGLVGINTTTPAYQLDVNGTINATSILVNGAPITTGASLWTSSGSNVFWSGTGNVGIGTTTPSYTLDVNGTIGSDSISVLAVGAAGSTTIGKNLNVAGTGQIGGNLTVQGQLSQLNGGLAVAGNTALGGNLTVDGTFNTNTLAITDLNASGNATISQNLTVNGASQMAGDVAVSGNVTANVVQASQLIMTGSVPLNTQNAVVSQTLAVGTNKNVPANYAMAVGGNIIATGVDIKIVEKWPDYVFTDEHKLLSIEEVEAYVKKNGHLPNVLSAKEMQEKKNYSIGEMDAKLMEKIEELTLYVISQNKALESQNRSIELLKKELEELKKKDSSGK